MSSFEQPAKKIKLSSDHQVLVHLSDRAFSSEETTFQHLKKQLGGEKIESSLIDLKIIHQLECIRIDYSSIRATCVATCQKKKELFVACTDCKIRVYDVESRELKRTISTFDYIPTRMVVGDEGEFIVFVTNSRKQWAIIRLGLLGEEKIDWEVCKDNSSKCELIYRKATSEIFVANWKAHKILVLDAISGS